MRALTIPIKKITREEQVLGRLLYPEDGHKTPRIRGECSLILKECPWCCHMTSMVVSFPNGGQAESKAFDRQIPIQQRELRTEELPLGNTQGAGKKQAQLSCPDCGGRVSFHLGMGGTDWNWEKYDPAEVSTRMDGGTSDIPTSILNRCRPCCFPSCRHHLYLDVNPSTGSIKMNFPDLELWELVETCALDVAERGGETLDVVGKYLNVTRERTRQIEILAIEHIEEMRGTAKMAHYAPERRGEPGFAAELLLP